MNFNTEDGMDVLHSASDFMFFSPFPIEVITENYKQYIIAIDRGLLFLDLIFLASVFIFSLLFIMKISQMFRK